MARYASEACVITALLTLGLQAGYGFREVRLEPLKVDEATQAQMDER